MATLIPIFISALPSLFSAGESLYSYIFSMKSALSQDAAWTSVEDAAWIAALVADGKTSEWTA